MKKIIVEEKDVGKRLDSYIAENYSELSRTMIKKIIETNNILVNEKKQKVSYKVQANDEICINVPKAKETKLEAENIPIEIIYEDNDIIVVNKPKGLVVHPANGNPDGTLVNAILAICKHSLSGIGGEIRPGIVHRLDKDTSGIIIVAKNDIAHINISNQIKERKVKKTYIALVRGNVPEEEATINMPIGRSTRDRKKMAVNKDGKPAITHFKVLKRYGKYTLLEVKIETGRTHQIRVHMAEIGYPIVGDAVYSNGKNEFGVEGQMLHAYKLEFEHPTTKKHMELIAPLPQYFKEILEKLYIIYKIMKGKIMEQIRLQKLLANSGICSRRKAEEYILAGKVKVNGKIITELGTKVNPAKDEVTFEGKVVKNVEDKIYILLNKPIGYVTTAKDQFNRETVLDLINIKEKVVPVGRLDMYTSGALILSNDGEFIYKVTHPKYEIEKAYNVTLKGKVTEEEIKALEKGVKIEDYVSGKAKVKILKIDEEKDVSRIEIIIHEGKNREVRKMCNAIGKKVLALHRSRIGNLNVKDLKIGEWKYLNNKQIESLIK